MTKEEFTKRWPRIAEWFEEDDAGCLTCTPGDYAVLERAILDDLKELPSKKTSRYQLRFVLSRKVKGT